MFLIFFVIWAVCSWDAFWHLTWLYFGRVLGGKLDLKSKKNRSWTYQEINLKINTSWNPKKLFLASNMGPQGGPQKLVLEVYFGLGRLLGPRWPQDLSRVPPRLIFLDFGSQLCGF